MKPCSVVPKLRIISDNLWSAAERIRSERAKIPGKPRELWSRHDGSPTGMVTCGSCGGHMIIAQRSRNGAGRFKCSAAHFHDTSRHTKSYDVARLEWAVVDAIDLQLTDPRTTHAIWQKYREELREEQRSARSERQNVRKRLNEIEAAQLRLAAALEKGSMPEDILISWLQNLEKERASLRERERIASQEEDPTDLSLKAMGAYRKHLRNLHENLQARRHDPEVRMAFRNVIKSITINETSARAPYGFKINGRLGALFGLELYPIGRPVSQALAEQGFSRALACYDSADTGKAGS
ncbi:zinc ribbon domain-containing protein [Microvirga vignae]|nr:zinc ribbon domain-containing protein [Microvirga vignae]